MKVYNYTKLLVDLILVCEYPTDILAWDRVEAGIIQSRLALCPLLRTTFVVPFVHGPWVYASVWGLSDYMLRCATGNPCGFHVPTVPRKMFWRTVLQSTEWSQC